jgi:hypothetical protein
MIKESRVITMIKKSRVITMMKESRILLVKSKVNVTASFSIEFF